MVLISPVEQHEPPNPLIKVKLSSRCIKCHQKLKKKVQKIQGVKDVNVVPERGGIVIISASCIDLNVLMEVIRKNYKNATLHCSLDIEEPRKKDGNNLSCTGDHGCEAHVEEEKDSSLSVKNLGSDASSISQASEEAKKKKKKKGWIMRIFEKKSNPSVTRPLAPRAPPPGPPQSTHGQMYAPANHGPFSWETRPRFRPEMQLRPPFLGLPPPPPPPSRELMPADYGGPPFPMLGYGGQPYPMSKPRLNPMVHYTNYTDNYPPHHNFRY